MLRNLLLLMILTTIAGTVKLMVSNTKLPEHLPVHTCIRYLGGERRVLTRNGHKSVWKTPKRKCWYYEEDRTCVADTIARAADMICPEGDY